MATGRHQVRVTGVLLTNGEILLVRQTVTRTRGWSLPGGRVEPGETLEEAIVREMREETGLTVSIERLLYLADKTEDDLLHVTFLLRWAGGSLRKPTNQFEEDPISDVRFVPLTELTEHGFSRMWRDLALASFPNAPAYVGEKKNIGL